MIAVFQSWVHQRSRGVLTCDPTFYVQPPPSLAGAHERKYTRSPLHDCTPALTQLVMGEAQYGSFGYAPLGSRCCDFPTLQRLFLIWAMSAAQPFMMIGSRGVILRNSLAGDVLNVQGSLRGALRCQRYEYSLSFSGDFTCSDSY